MESLPAATDVIPKPKVNEEVLKQLNESCARLDPNAKRIYAIYRGRKVGLFSDYRTVLELTQKQRNAVHRRFDREHIEDAKAFVINGPQKPRNLMHIEGASKLQEQKMFVSQFLTDHCTEEQLEQGALLICDCDASVRNIRDLPNTRNRFAAGVVVSWAVHFGVSDPRNNQGLLPRFTLQTNNAGEVFACIKALQNIRETPRLHKWDMLNNQIILIRTDSMYVVDELAKLDDPEFTKRLRPNSPNRGLLRTLHDLVCQMPVLIMFNPGHVGLPGNEAANTAAREARMADHEDFTERVEEMK